MAPSVLSSDIVSGVDAYLAFGGNIGDAVYSICSAWSQLDHMPNIKVIARSFLYRTEAIGGPSGQPDYVNAACRISTDLPPRDLLDVCLLIERDLGRERIERWGPRTLDIDLLLYGNRLIAESDLSVPHPRMRGRMFVLGPLADVMTLDTTLPPDGKPFGDVLGAALESTGETISLWRDRRLTQNC